jgi:drug/metabolite transporter (DMT)-like permease
MSKATAASRPKRNWLAFALAALFFFGVTNFILGFIAEKNAGDPSASIKAAMILWLGTGVLGVCGAAYFKATQRRFSGLSEKKSWWLPVAAGVTLALGMLLLKTSLAANPFAKGPIVAVTSSNSLIVALLAWLTLREELSPGQWAGFLVIVAGIVWVSLGGMAGNRFGAAGYAIGAMVLFGLTNFFLKYAGERGCDSLASAIVLWLSVGACGVLAVFWHVLRYSRFPLLGRREHAWLALLAGVFLALGMLAIKKAVTLGPAGPAAAVSGSNAILVSLLDYWLLGHWQPPMKLAGMAIVIAGIVALALAGPAGKQARSPGT